MEAVLYTAAFVFFAICFIHWRWTEHKDRVARESKARTTLFSSTQEWYRIESQHGPTQKANKPVEQSGRLEARPTRYEGSE